MENSTRIGRVLFGMGMLGFGALNLIFARPVFGIEPQPGWLHGPLWAWLTGLLLLMGGFCLLIDQWRPRAAAIGVGLLLLLWVLLHVVALLTHPRDGGEWTTGFECLALCCAAWMLADALPARSLPGTAATTDRVRQLAVCSRYAFGASLPVFGVLHFIYWQYVASVIPVWIPGSPVFWAYFTGCAHVAAGLAILAGVQARLAATLLGIMFGSWVLLLHIPRALAHPHSQAEWTSLFVAIALCGGAWLLAGYLARAARSR